MKRNTKREHELTAYLTIRLRQDVLDRFTAMCKQFSVNRSQHLRDMIEWELYERGYLGSSGSEGVGVKE